MRILIAALMLAAGAAYGQGSNYFVPGCALTGTATSQVVNLAASGCITGNLPVTNLFGGIGASATSYLSGAGWGTPPGVAAGTGNQIQFNNAAGAFAANANLSWNNAAVDLLVGTASAGTNAIVTIGGSGAGVGTVQGGGGGLALKGNGVSISSTLGVPINITGSIAPTGPASGSSISLTAGATGYSATTPGGAITLTAGTGNAGQTGGFVNVVAGSGYTTLGTGGDVSIQGGVGNTAALSGNVEISTFNTQRLKIDKYGTWYLGTDPGTPGECAESGGAGVATAWGTCLSTASAPTLTGAWTFDAGATFNGAGGIAIYGPAATQDDVITFGQSGQAVWQVYSTASSNDQHLYNSGYGDVMIFGGNGGITTQGQTNEGAGTINAAGLYVGGVKIPKIVQGGIQTGTSNCIVSGGSGITSCTYNGIGNVTVNFVTSYSGFFSCSAISTAVNTIMSIPSETASSVQVFSYLASTQTSTNFYILCVGN